LPRSLAAAALDRRTARPRVGRYGAAAIACFAGLVVWQGISINWSVQPDRSWDYVNRGLTYVAFWFLACSSARSYQRATRVFAGGLAVLLALVLGYALLAKGIPRSTPTTGGSRGCARRSASGMRLPWFGDFALVLGLWRAAQRRFDGVLLVFAGLLTVLLAYSRGGLAIAAIAAAAWLVLDRRRLESLLALVIGGGAALAVAGVSLALHGVSDDGQPHAVRVHDGRLFLLTVVIAATVVAIPRTRRAGGSSRRRRCVVARSPSSPALSYWPLRAASPLPRSTAAARRARTARKARAASSAGALTRDSTGGSRRCNRSRTSRSTGPVRRRSSSRTGCAGRSPRRP
jgi:hypothetical protein